MSFNMTLEGCSEATEFLKAIRGNNHYATKYDEFMNNKTSTDGYSLVYYANSLLDKESTEEI